MTVITIGDLLDQLNAIEQDMARYYAQTRDRTRDNSVKLLTYFLARHRQHLAGTIAGLDKETARQVRDIVLGDTSALAAIAEPHRRTAASEVTGPDLIRAVIEYDRKLVALYRDLLVRIDNDEARGLFTTLIQLEERDISMLNKMLEINYF